MERSEPTDADLVAQSLAGDREAFGSLYDRYAPVVRAVAGGVSWDWPAVEDMTQESFLRAYRNLGKLREPPRFGAWIVGIARQVARERKRALRRDRHKFTGERPPDIASSGDGAREMQDADEMEMVMEKLIMLPERERLAINAFFFDQHAAQRAAALLGISRSGFYALLGRALGHLAALVRPCDAQQEANR